MPDMKMFYLSEIDKDSGALLRSGHCKAPDIVDAWMQFFTPNLSREGQFKKFFLAQHGDKERIQISVDSDDRNDENTRVLLQCAESCEGYHQS